MFSLEKIKSTYLFIMVVLIISGIQLFVEELTEVGILGMQILFWLCLFNVVYVSLKNLRNKSSFRPKSTKEQIVRFLVVGVGNICLFTSFQYISAASYSTLTRIDIPIIIVISAVALRQATKKFYLSLFVLLMVGFILVESQRVDEEFIGYILVIFGVFGKVVNTLLKKKMSTTESMEIIILVGSLSGLIWSSVLMNYQGVSPIEMNPVYIFEIVVLSLLNLTLNYSLIHLFRRHSAEAVRFPYIIAAVLTMVLEMVIEQKFFSWILIATNLALLSLMAMLVWNRKPKMIQEEVI